MSVFRAGDSREDRCETVPSGVELQEQRSLEQRDTDHEEVSADDHLTFAGLPADTLDLADNQYWLIWSVKSMIIIGQIVFFIADYWQTEELAFL